MRARTPSRSLIVARISQLFLSFLAASVVQNALALPASGAADPATTAADPAGAGATRDSAAPGVSADAAATAERPTFGAPVAGGLTSDQVAERVMRTSPGVRAQASAKDAADFALDQARAGYLPRLETRLSYTRASREDSPSLGNIVVAPPGTPPGQLPPGTELASAPLGFPSIVDNYEARLSLGVPLSDYVLRLPQLHDAARSDAHAAALLLEATRLQEASDARIVYYEWLRARLSHDVALGTLERTRAQLEDARHASEIGTASLADVLAVEAQVANAELLVTRARGQSELLQERLRLLMHDEGEAPYAVGEDLSDVARATEARARAGSARELIARAHGRRLELAVLSARANATRERAAAARAAELPRLEAFGSASYANPNSRVLPPSDEFQGTWEAGLQLTWSPTDSIAASAQRNATVAQARQLEAERDELLDAVALEVRSALRDLTESEVALGTSERELAAAAEAYRVRRELFRNGRATSVELTDAEVQWTEAQLDVVSARVDQRVAQVKLLHATGDDTPQARR
jgi:outer membrane protein TolC